MSTLRTLLKKDSGHVTPRGEVCRKPTFKCEALEVGGGARCFCEKCKKEVVIVGNKVAGSEQYK